MYKIIGVDGKEYGPITAEVLRQWIAQGRANVQTRTLWENGTDWQPLGTLPEFANIFATATTPASLPLTAGIVRKTNGFATAGMVFGILSLMLCCCYGLPLNILGIIFSCIALSQINRHPEIYEGRGLAITGLVLSIASILFYGAILVWALATNNLNGHWNFNQFGQ